MKGAVLQREQDLKTVLGYRVRYYLLDSIRGFTIISMILYHAIWDLVYLFGNHWNWYQGMFGRIWQQSICWTFILLSGFCWSMGKRRLRRGLIVFGAGALVTIVTSIAMPDQRILFGILTLQGSCMLLLILLQPILKKVPAWVGVFASILLFLIFRQVNNGFLGFLFWKWISLPEQLYYGWFSAYLGFTPDNFSSTDYFPLLPWLFLFLSGYFIYRVWERNKPAERFLDIDILPLRFLGQHSLFIYLLHQPVVYFILMIWYEAVN